MRCGDYFYVFSEASTHVFVFACNSKKAPCHLSPPHEVKKQQTPFARPVSPLQRHPNGVCGLFLFQPQPVVRVAPSGAPRRVDRGTFPEAQASPAGSGELFLSPCPRERRCTCAFAPGKFTVVKWMEKSSHEIYTQWVLIVLRSTKRASTGEEK